MRDPITRQWTRIVAIALSATIFLLSIAGNMRAFVDRHTDASWDWAQGASFMTHFDVLALFKLSLTLVALACLFVPRKPAHLLVTYTLVILAALAVSPLLLIAKYAVYGELSLQSPELTPLYFNALETLVLTLGALFLLWRPGVRESFGWQVTRAAV